MMKHRSDTLIPPQRKILIEIVKLVPDAAGALSQSFALRKQFPRRLLYRVSGFIKFLIRLPWIVAAALAPEFTRSPGPAEALRKLHKIHWP
jgi:hypothetical protein